jgi:hypothetical protein
MAKTYPVPTWVRTAVCLASFTIAAFIVVMCLITGRGFESLLFASALSAAVIRKMLTKQ